MAAARPSPGRSRPAQFAVPGSSSSSTPSSSTGGLQLVPRPSLASCWRTATAASAASPASGRAGSRGGPGEGP
eukprot:9016895-Alexandrium_andersonii.AAC.1